MSLTYGGTAYPRGYDNAGNLTETDDGTGDGEDDDRYFHWDYNDKLAKITTSTSGGALKAEYTYDAQGRRVLKDASTDTRYVYNGWQCIEEYVDSGSGFTLTRTYVYGNNIDEVLELEIVGAAKYYYHTNVQGNVVALTDASGGVIEKIEYDLYGRMTKAWVWNDQTEVFDPITQSGDFLTATEYYAGSLTKNPYLFQGRRLDEESGLYYFRNRQYDPVHGRFLSRDPEGYKDSYCLYQFVNNNPVNYVDPYGLSLSIDVEDEIFLPIEDIKGFFERLPVVGSSLASAIDSVTEHVPDKIGYKIKMNADDLCDSEFKLEVKWIKGVGSAKREIGVSIAYFADTGQFEAEGSYEFRWGPPAVLGFELSASGEATFTVSSDAVFSLAGKVTIKAPEVNLPWIGSVTGNLNWEGKITIFTLAVMSGDIAVLDVDLDPIVDPGPAWQGNLYQLIGIQNPFQAN